MMSKFSKQKSQCGNTDSQTIISNSENDDTTDLVVSHQKSETPFGDMAIPYNELGLNVLPIKIGDKKPSIKWACFQDKRQSAKTIKKLESQFSEGNIALLTGKVSKVTVVDDDNSGMSLKELFMMFGRTPYVVKTPSGGWHLYYRYNGEGCKQRVNGLPIDIRGQGGYVVAPPSFNPKYGRSYEVVRGVLSDLASLPAMNEGAVTAPAQTPSHTVTCEGIKEGGRNEALFYYLKSIALDVESEEDLLEMAHTFNKEQCVPALADDEVVSTAKKVWQYKQEHRLINKGEGGVFISKKDIEELGSSVLHLLAFLKMHHKVGDTFPVSPVGVGKLMNKSESTIGRLREALVALERIVLIKKGKKGRYDPSIYGFKS